MGVFFMKELEVYLSQTNRFYSSIHNTSLYIINKVQNGKKKQNYLIFIYKYIITILNKINNNVVCEQYISGRTGSLWSVV